MNELASVGWDVQLGGEQNRLPGAFCDGVAARAGDAHVCGPDRGRAKCPQGMTVQRRILTERGQRGIRVPPNNVVLLWAFTVSLASQGLHFSGVRGLPEFRGSAVFVRARYRSAPCDGKRERALSAGPRWCTGPARGGPAFEGFERPNFGIIHIRTDGERVLAFTHSGKAGMNEAYRFTVTASGDVQFASTVIKRSAPPRA